MHTSGTEVSGFIGIIIVQVTILIIYGIFVRYDYEMLPTTNVTSEEFAAIEKQHRVSYPHFQDVHVMIFLGFAYLMTFLKKYGFSASGFNLLVAAISVQWAFLARGVFQLDNGLIRISLSRVIEADIAAAVVLISMGALLGRTTPIQLLLMALIEIVVYSSNEYFQIELLKITDAGGSIIVHAFGAYFGLAVSFVMRMKREENNAGTNEGSSYTSDIFAFCGTIFLWLFWPSFNSALLDDISQQHRAILNTYLSLAAATVSTFVVSAIVSHQHKLDMVHIQNSTLAGGVAIGAVCNLLVSPHGALLIGTISAIISVFGYRYLTPFLVSQFRLHDTCGVNNLHGLPAILSAIFSMFYASVATTDIYKDSLNDIFPAMNWKNSSYALEHNTTITVGGFGRTNMEQAGYQALGIISTILIALIFGALTGVVLNLPAMRNLKKDEHHDDDIFWNIPDDFKHI
ncbi:ammonium transporter Rh type A [Contarinia nasturtii]|uniref:ammonium transporter Rh type A n=1 Tax=Contarinia nasturtii TaxID=265458 RepID=UPI0012D40DF8|nr:ammonium transporter Rh type A [Contarinia nasturtii]